MAAKKGGSHKKATKQAKATKEEEGKPKRHYGLIPRTLPETPRFRGLPDDGKLLLFILRSWREMRAACADKMDPDELREWLPGWDQARLLAAWSSLEERDLAHRFGRWVWDVEGFDNYKNSANHNPGAENHLAKAPPELRAAFARRYPGILDGIDDPIHDAINHPISDATRRTSNE